MLYFISEYSYRRPTWLFQKVQYSEVHSYKRYEQTVRKNRNNNEVLYIHIYRCTTESSFRLWQTDELWSQKRQGRRRSNYNLAIEKDFID